MLDDDFVQAFKQRFSGRPEWNRPELWPVVMDPRGMTNAVAVGHGIPTPRKPAS